MCRRKQSKAEQSMHGGEERNDEGYKRSDTTAEITSLQSNAQSEMSSITSKHLCRGPWHSNALQAPSFRARY